LIPAVYAHRRACRISLLAKRVGEALLRRLGTDGQCDPRRSLRPTRTQWNARSALRWGRVRQDRMALGSLTVDLETQVAPLRGHHAALPFCPCAGARRRKNNRIGDE
jgi:hypothetical protein